MPTIDQRHPKEESHRKRTSDKTLKSPNSIVFLRRRILYGRVEFKKKAPSGLGQTRTSFAV